jgi:hypothetical protein
VAIVNGLPPDELEADPWHRLTLARSAVAEKFDHAA